MEYLHLTSKKNIKSILTNGILPSYIKLEDHWDVFNSLGLKKRKCIYTWSGETFNNTKFIKDMIYTKFFIHPRNNLYNIVEHDDAIDFRKFGNKIYGNDETFYLLKIHTLDDWLGEFTHSQEPNSNRFSTTSCMDDKYAHDDKILGISSELINPINFKIIEQINVRTYKNNTLGFSFSKHR